MLRSRSFLVGRSPWTVIAFAGGLLAIVTPTLGQSPAGSSIQALSAASTGYSIIPQCRRWSTGGVEAVQVKQVDVGVVVNEQVAATTMDVTLVNTTAQRKTANLLMPVPPGAVVRSFTFQGASDEPTARLLKHDEARKTFDAIVARMKDPALLEFAGMNLVRSSVFPVEANGEQKVRLTYEHILPAEGDRVDYVLPRSQSLVYQVPWKIHVKIKSQRGVSTAYSPTHAIETKRPSPKQVSVRLSERAEREPGPFRLSYLIDGGEVTASMFTFPDAERNGGYFLLLAGVQSNDDLTQPKVVIERELTLVLDRSGSMNGEKLEQAREAALQVLAGLKRGEAFNLIIYNDAVEKFAPAPVEKNKETMQAARAFLDNVTAQGGTNIHDALSEALRPEPNAGRLPIVLFLTDGLPTVGQTSEAAIRKVARERNPHHRRIFSFGVGVDVNTPLLDKIAVSTRGFSTFVLPGEDVEVKVAKVFRGLQGPVLAAPELLTVDRSRKPQPGRVLDLLPERLPDLFAGDQLVLLGRYVGDEPLRFVLRGMQGEQRRAFRLKFDLTKASPKNAFVSRLWASRKIGVLTDQIRDLGASPQQAVDANADARLKELTDEIVRLSTKFGILTEYTAFLAREGTDLSKRDGVLAEAARNFRERAVNVRSGLASVNQEWNNALQRNLTCLNPTNCYLDANMQRVAISNVQQIGDRAFYRRGGRWVDAAYVQDKDVKPEREVSFGSPEFSRLLWRMVREGKQPTMSLGGDVLVQVDGKPVLVKGPPAPAKAPPRPSQGPPAPAKGKVE